MSEKIVFTLMWTLSLALILGTQIILPIVSKKNVRLGVTFPKESLREKRLLKILENLRPSTSNGSCGLGAVRNSPAWM